MGSFSPFSLYWLIDKQNKRGLVRMNVFFPVGASGGYQDQVHEQSNFITFERTKNEKEWKVDLIIAATTEAMCKMYSTHNLVLAHYF
jgi:hypothetical protein